MKVVSVFPGNPSQNGRPVISATILLNDPTTGEISALMDGGDIAVAAHVFEEAAEMSTGTVV